MVNRKCDDQRGCLANIRKTKQVKTLKAGEALEEALCFGWIDGVMKKVDEHSYLKYFARRRKTVSGQKRIKNCGEAGRTRANDRART